MPQDKKNIYRFLKQNNLTQKSEEEFNSEYNNSPEKQEQLYAFFKDNNLTQKDKDSFTQEYFGSIGKGKGATTEQSQGGTPSPIVEQELPVGIINKNKVLPYDKNVDKTTVGTPSPSQPLQPSEESGIKQDILNKYPALKNVYGQQGENLVIDADTNFKPFEIGFGGIEFYAPEQSEITYGKGYSYKHPSKGKYAVKYNPEKAGGQDIFLDLLHGMDADPEYKKLREEFKKQTLKDRDGDIEYFYNKDKKEGFAEDGKERWIDNYVDGLIRSELAVGSEDYAKEASGNSKEMKAIASRLNDYLISQPLEESGAKPSVSNNQSEQPKSEDIESLVRKLEGNNNYNAYAGSPNNASVIFEDMTIGEVLDWQRKNKEKAVGAYQFKPDTLKDAINSTEGISLDSKFDSSTQDALSNYLFDRRGRQDYINGNIDSIEYANNLAKEFASLPVVTDMVTGSGKKVKRGETYYSGTNNKSLIDAEEYENIIKNIKPVDSQEQIVSDK